MKNPISGALGTRIRIGQSIPASPGAPKFIKIHFPPRRFGARVPRSSPPSPTRARRLRRRRERRPTPPRSAPRVTCRNVSRDTLLVSAPANASCPMNTKRIVRLLCTFAV